MPVKILVAEDSVTMRKVLELTFAGEDADVVAVASAAEAFEAAQQNPPDVVFADGTMEGEDGYDLARKLKSTPALSRAAVILLCSTHHPYDLAKGKACGVDDSLEKPFDSAMAIQKITEVMVKPRASASAAPAAKKSPSGPMQAAPARPSKHTVAFGTPAAPQSPARPAVPAPAAAAKPAARPAAPAAAKPAARPAAPAAAKPASASPASASVISATGAQSPLAAKLEGLGLEGAQLQAILALSREVVEQVVWEVVPEIAESIIREEIRRLTAE